MVTMTRTLIASLVSAALATSLASADSPRIKQVQNARLSEGTPIWIELTATEAFVTLDAVRDRHHERMYLFVPLKNELGSKLLYDAVAKAFETKSLIGVTWIETPDLGTTGPEWRRAEGHQYWQLQSIYSLTPDSTEPYTAPPRVVGPHGEIKK
jgi:hypothetical protein